ncbi:hypothetical protein BMS3Abin03_00091 [bacterium BMS3Abin03]|nr:hypothetical protein BMS3Abin03_00091 [bacterium BMS3Abin03]
MIYQRLNIVLFIFLLTTIAAGNLYSQRKFKNGNGWGGFHLTSFRGNLFLRGDYRSQKNELNTGFREEQKSGAFSGEINIYSTSYLLHPNFLMIGLDLGFAPGTQKNNFIVAPNRTDTRTAERMNLNLNFFNQRMVSFKIFTNYNHGFISRELTTDVESYQFNAGTYLAFRNSSLPATLSYLHSTWKQNELQFDRKFESTRNNINLRLDKGISDWNENVVTASYEDYFRTYANDISVKNQILTLNLNSRFIFDEERNIYNYQFWYYKQIGSQPYRRIQFEHSLISKPIKSIRLNGRYQFHDLIYSFAKSLQHYLTGTIEHQLFNSLRSHLSYEYTDSRQTFYNEVINQATVGFKYQKKIPTGIFRLNYEYRLRGVDRASQASRTQLILDEEHSLTDGTIELLDNPDVILESVVVTDFKDTYIYVENLDYLLIPRGEFTEIVRIPGGQIPDGATVYVDYEFDFREDFNYTATGNNFTVGLTFLYNLFDVYFSYRDFDYKRVQGVGFNVLEYFNQRIVGAKTTIDFITVGFEFDDYNSNIIPYQSSQFFIDIRTVFFNRLKFNVSGNYRDYFLTKESERQIYRYGTGGLGYLFSSVTKFDLIVNTRFQNGRGINLDLYSVRSEFETQFRNITIVLGYENFFRNFSNEKVNYNKLYLRIGRRF